MAKKSVATEVAKKVPVKATVTPPKVSVIVNTDITVEARIPSKGLYAYGNVSNGNDAKMEISINSNGEVEDVICTGKVMDICSSGMEDILDSSDDAFANTVAIVTEIRKKYKEQTSKK